MLHSGAPVSGSLWHWISLPNITQFSDWTFSGLTPTAIKLTHLDVQSRTTGPTVLLLLGNVVLAGAGVAIWKRRR